MNQDFRTNAANIAPALPSLLLLIDISEDGGKLQLRPIDPTTLGDKLGYAPLDFGHHYDYTFSPDGHTLAAIVWPSGSSNQDGELRLVDLSTWEDLPTGVRFNNYVNMLEFSPDGNSLYWVAATRITTAHGLPDGFELRRYDLEKQVDSFVTSIPFAPVEARLFANGSRLALYGVPVDAGNLAADWPHVLIVDLAVHTIRADIRLDGLLDWQRQVKTGGGEISYQMDRAGLAWDLDRQRLYIVHATEDKLTVVDLEREKVQNDVHIQTRQSLIDRLIAFIASPAYAKAVPGTERRMQLSPDGRRLYIVSMRRELEQAAGGNMIWREIPLGLQVVETRQLQEIRRVDLPVDTFALSPEGERLLLTGTQYETVFNEEAYQVQESGLYVFDTKNLEPILHLQPPGEKFFLLGFSPDSRNAYFSSYDSDRGGSLHLQVLDMESLQVAGKRSLPSGFGDLLGMLWTGNR